MQLAEPYFFEGGKRAVLLLHAYTGSTADVRRTGRALQKAGYTVYSINFTGHATNRIEDILEAGPEQWYEDTKSAVEYLHDRGHDEVAIFGLSLGGAFALRAALDGLSTVGAGLFCSAIMENLRSENVYNQFLRTAKKQKENKDVPEEQLKKEMTSIEEQLPDQLTEVDEFIAGIREDLDDLTLPFYIAQAGQDELINPKSGTMLEMELHNTPTTLHSFPEATHVITISDVFVEFQDTLVDFVNRLDWKE